MATTTLKALCIEWPVDDYPDLSYLRQDYADERSPVRRNQYRKQDRERLAAYGNGDWDVIGVVAVADVEVDTGNGNAWRTTHTLRSSGIHGVESDSDPAYLATLAREQLAELREILAALGIAWDNTLAERAIP